MAYKEGWVLVNGIPTHVLTWGCWIDDPKPDGKSIILCISGNPGVTPFYKRFLCALNKQLDMPIWILSHAGHELPPMSINMKMPKNNKLFTLSGQIQHKAAFIKKYIPEDQNIYFIGHSVGAKIVSELLKNENLCKRTKKCYLVFPTLERIAETPNAKFFIPLATYFTPTILFFAWIFSCFPNMLRSILVKTFFIVARRIKIDETCLEAALHLILPAVLKKVFFLAMDEMDTIKELEIQALNEFKDKLKIYFTPTDNWAPLSHYESLKAAMPDIDATVLSEQFQHAFVLDMPEETATRR
uniref:Lipid droplet-associated hydrolase n=1 Tax=Clastoptera arizonana TaxID=38151 RepID=A0A1B6CN59_9HEMI